MRRGYRIIALILATLLPTATFAADPKLVKAVSDHFELYTTDNEAAAKGALEHFESVRAYLLRATNAPDPFQTPIRIVGFRSHGEFSSYEPRGVEGGKAFSTAAGDRVTIVIETLKKETYEFGTREYVSLLMARAAPSMPYWLRLGFSELYSTLHMDNGQIVLGMPPARGYRAGNMPELNMALLFALRPGDVKGDKQANAFYANNNNPAFGRGVSGMDTIADGLTQDYPLIAYELAHMMMFKREYSSKFGAFVSAVSQGADSAATFSKVYNQSLTGVAQDLSLYWKLPSHASVSIKFQLEKPVSPQVAQLSAAESAPILAALKASR